MYNFGEIAWMFLIYAIIGWCWETPYVSFKEKKFVNRGFLRGPIIPIYGYAATTIMVVLKWCDDKILIEGFGRIALIFVFAAIVASIWEYVTSAILEALFKTRWWDYSNLKFNLKGRISLGTSLFWGFGSTILWLYVNSGIINFYHSVPADVMRAVLSVAYIIIMIDTVLTMKELISFRSLIIKLQETSEEMVANLNEKHGEFKPAGVLNEAKNNIKTKVSYIKYEGLQSFNEFSEEMAKKGKELSVDNEALNKRFKESLDKMKANNRFFKTYPNAKTKHFPMLNVGKKFDAVILDIKKQKNSKSNKKDK